MQKTILNKVYSMLKYIQSDLENKIKTCRSGSKRIKFSIDLSEIDRAIEMIKEKEEHD